MRSQALTCRRQIIVSTAGFDMMATSCGRLGLFSQPRAWRSRKGDRLTQDPAVPMCLTLPAATKGAIAVRHCRVSPAQVHRTGVGLLTGRSGSCRHSSRTRPDVRHPCAVSSTANTPLMGTPHVEPSTIRNRANQVTFSFISCRHAARADVIAAPNIRCRAEAALVTRP
jgi:hypothetical protein